MNFNADSKNTSKQKQSEQPIDKKQKKKLQSAKKMNKTTNTHSYYHV